LVGAVAGKRTSVRDLSEIKVRAPRSVGEAARWVAFTLASLVIAYFVLTFILLVTGVWGGE
jgi:hypothetical protein